MRFLKLLLFGYKWGNTSKKLSALNKLTFTFRKGWFEYKWSISLSEEERKLIFNKALGQYQLLVPKHGEKRSRTKFGNL